MNLDYLNESIVEAEKAYKEDEVPVGAIVVKDDKIIARAHNTKEKNTCALFHAELIAIYNATRKLNNWRLNDCDLYVSLDPCPMCASAIKQSRIRNIYSALSNSASNLILIKSILKKDSTNPGVNFETNLNKSKSEELLNGFFKKQRIK